MKLEEYFEKVRLSANQLKTVADRRRDDARFLIRTGEVRRNNTAVYLYGIAIECLLKGLLLDREGWLESASRESVRGDRRKSRIYSLRYSHDLDEILGTMPQLKFQLEAAEDAFLHFSHVKLWTVHIRYAPRQVNKVEATDFQVHAEEVFRWLRHK